MAGKSQRAIAIFFVATFIISSCALTIMVVITMFTQDSKKPNEAEQKALDALKQQQAQNPNKLAGTKLANFTPTSSVTELQKIDVTPGTGATVKAGDQVTVEYTGALATDGMIFESSKDTGQPASFKLDEVIAGWSQGIPGMKVGGTRRLVIPANLAYGSQGNASIPPNTPLVFDVTVQRAGK